jgi:hypothetical protein
MNWPARPWRRSSDDAGRSAGRRIGHRLRPDRRAQRDILGFVCVACLTAMGGGTLRGGIIDRPMFRVNNLPRVHT